MKIEYPERYFRRPPPQAFGFEDVGNGKRYKVDAVVVGSGPGGATTAKILSEAGLKTLILEMGPKKSRFQKNYAHTAKYHMQENGAMVASGKAMIPIAAGKGVGGSTLINSALSFRAPEKVLLKWETLLEDPRWGPESIGDIYGEIEQYIGVGTTREKVAGKNNALLVRGIEKMGFKGGLAPRSTPLCIGCGICYFGCPTNGKSSVNLNYLPAAVNKGAIIQAETHVESIVVDKGTATGVIGRAIDPDTGTRGGVVEVEASIVILSAGAIGTPRLLWQSGLAKRLGPAVGNNLQIHPGSTLLGISDDKIEMWKGATQGAYFTPENIEGTLPHTFSAPPEACLTAGGFIGDRFQEGMALLPYLCGMLVMVSDTGTGSVRATRSGLAKIKYDFHPNDVDRIKAGLVEVAKVLIAGGAHDLRAPIWGLKPVNDPEDLANQLKDKKIQDFTLYAAHPMGTCRMGKKASNSVVDADGQTHNLRNLFVADASIFPSSLGVNPQLSTIAASTIVARGILAR